MHWLHLFASEYKSRCCSVQTGSLIPESLLFPTNEPEQMFKSLEGMPSFSSLKESFARARIFYMLEIFRIFYMLVLSNWLSVKVKAASVNVCTSGRLNDS